MARGLLMRLRMGFRSGRGEPTGRCLLNYLNSPFTRWRRRPNEKGKSCTWCGGPTEGRKEWHSECVRWYLTAKGQTVYPASGTLLLSVEENEARYRARRRRDDAARQYAHAVADRELVRLGLPKQYRGEDPETIEIPPAPDPIRCVECGEPYSEVDHTIALSVAHERRVRGDRRWWRAWTPANLRPLCSSCHTAKTTLDRRELAYLRRLPLGPESRDRLTYESPANLSLFGE